MGHGGPDPRRLIYPGIPKASYELGPHGPWVPISWASLTLGTILLWPGQGNLCTTSMWASGPEPATIFYSELAARRTSLEGFY